MGAIGIAAMGNVTARADDDGLYAGLSLGQIRQSINAQDPVSYDPTSGRFSPGVLVSSSHDSLGGALSLGYRLNQYFAAELSFLNTGTAENTYSFSNSASVVTASRVSGPVLSLLPSYSFGGSFRGYLRAGVLFAHKKSSQATALGEFAITYGDTSWVGGVGAEYSLSEHWNMNLEYLRSGTLDEPVGSSDHLTAVTLGVNYKF